MNGGTTILDDFGHEFVTHIRDSTVRYCRSIIDAENPKAKLDQLVQRAINSYEDDHREILREQLVPLIVDITIANFFWFLQQKYEGTPTIIRGMSLVIRDQNGKEYNLEEISDGLAGDFDWWVEQYNKEGIFNPK